MTSNQVTLYSDSHVPAAAVERGISAATWNALKAAIYPGASEPMIMLAIDYCRARGLDPLKKPVHIVKTWDSRQRREVETLWEGINSIRVTAARTNSYAGIDEPTFGPDVDRSWRDKDDGEVTVTFPAWCAVRVYRMVNGQRVPFVGMVRWMEAYASKSGGVPNAMWRKRPYAQIAKCAEAEALRKAFPEEVGERETGDEAPAILQAAPQIEFAGPDPLLAGVIEDQPESANNTALAGGTAQHVAVLEDHTDSPQTPADSPPLEPEIAMLVTLREEARWGRDSLNAFLTAKNDKAYWRVANKHRAELDEIIANAAAFVDEVTK